MKNIHKYALIIVGIVSILFLSGCAVSPISWKHEWVDGLLICYNVYSKEAFAGHYKWSGDENDMTVAIPDDYRGYKITALGGISNKYNTFGIYPPNELNGKKMLYYSVQVPPCEPNEDNTVELTFTVRLGVNINKLKEFTRERNFRYANEDDLEHCTFYTVNYYYICDEENETFYSKDGVLYLKSDNSKAVFEDGQEQ